MAGSVVRRVVAAGVACVLAHAAPAILRAQALDPVGQRRERLQRLGEVVQRRLDLTNDQALRLRAVSTRYARERQAVVAAERDARLVLRDEVPRGPGADQARVRQALDALVAAQQQRAALLAAEQRDLAAFLTPMQRARYLALQERAQRAAQRALQARLGEVAAPDVPDSNDGQAFGRPRRRY